MDVKKVGLLRRYEVFTHNGTKGSGLDPVAWTKQVEELGAGEVVLNSIDQDGEMKGYDLTLVEQVRQATTLPMTVLGGAGSLNDLEAMVGRFGTIGAAAGSLFVFKGKYKAVLINYPSRDEKDALFERARGNK